MILDIFNDDAFTLASMSAAIDKVEYVPDTILSSGVFTPNPIRTEAVAVEKRDGTIRVVPFSNRGQERPTVDKTSLRKLVNITTPRISQTQTIRASELNFLREFGTEDQIIEVQKEIARRQFGPNGMVADIEFSLERMALGALNGKILDENGDVLYDFYSLLDETETADITLDLSAGNGALRKEITQKILRPMRSMAQGAKFQYMMALCGKTAFDELNDNPEYYQSYITQQNGQAARDSYFEKPVNFAGVVWMEYQGTDDGSYKVADNEVKFVPWGNNNIYEHVMSPAESFADIGSLGQRLYSRVVPDLKRQEFVELDVETYSLMLNKRPDLKIKATVSA